MSNLKHIDFSKATIEANGKTYQIEKEMSISRYMKFEELQNKLGWGVDFGTLYGKLSKVYEALNKSKNTLERMGVAGRTLAHFDFSFHLILCRNLVFTYFADPVQRRVSEQIAMLHVPGGFIVIRKHEAVPGGMQQLLPSDGRLRIYRAVC